jgi:predicted HicB family RNase H-like nuclease
MEKKNALAKGFSLPKKPKATPISEKKAKTFEAPQKLKRQQKNQGSKLRRASSGVRIAVYIPQELEEKLRVQCAQKRTSISQAVTESIEMWLKG